MKLINFYNCVNKFNDDGIDLDNIDEEQGMMMMMMMMMLLLIMMTIIIMIN